MSVSAEPTTEALLAFALDLADIADAIAMPHFEAQQFVVETKADRSEVTVADRSTETAIADAILQRYPDHQIFGEEFGVRGGSSEWQWIIDPIDGTSNFVRRVPIWCTLIAVRHRDTLHAGVASAPALGHRWWGARGLGSFRDGAPIHVSAVDSLANAFISYSDGHWTDVAQRARLGDMLIDCGRQRSLGDFWQHVLVAEGAIDIALEPIVSLWDLAALQIIVEEAGGTFTDLAGAARPDGGNALSTNGVLHDLVLSRISE